VQVSAHREAGVRRRVEAEAAALHRRARAAHAGWQSQQSAADALTRSAELSERAWQLGEGSLAETLNARRLAHEARLAARLAGSTPANRATACCSTPTSCGRSTWTTAPTATTTTPEKARLRPPPDTRRGAVQRRAEPPASVIGPPCRNGQTRAKIGPAEQGLVTRMPSSAPATNPARPVEPAARAFACPSTGPTGGPRAPGRTDRTAQPVVQLHGRHQPPRPRCVALDGTLGIDVGCRVTCNAPSPAGKCRPATASA
jgi:hypothetical protein